jgi:hypothetical protein
MALWCHRFLTPVWPSYILADSAEGWDELLKGRIGCSSDPQRLADGNPEGEVQVPLRRSCALVPQAQDAHESTQAYSSPGRKFVDLDYRCDQCGAEVLRAVPRVR